MNLLIEKLIAIEKTVASGIELGTPRSSGQCLATELLGLQKGVHSADITRFLINNKD